MVMAFSDVLVHSRKGARRALVMTPTAHRRLGRERLEQLRLAVDESPIETSLVERVAGQAELYHVVVFRGRNDDDTGSWGFQRELDPDEARELAGLLVAAHVPTHRCLLRHGTLVMVHTDFGAVEAELMRAASLALHDRLAAAGAPDPARTAVHEANLWILRHLAFYFSLRFEKVIDSVLPDKLPLIEMRARPLAGLIEALRTQEPSAGQ